MPSMTERKAIFFALFFLHWSMIAISRSPLYIISFKRSNSSSNSLSNSSSNNHILPAHTLLPLQSYFFRFPFSVSPVSILRPIPCQTPVKLIKLPSNVFCVKLLSNPRNNSTTHRMRNTTMITTTVISIAFKVPANHHSGSPGSPSSLR